MKKVLLGAMLLAVSAPSFAAPTNLVTRVLSINVLQKGGLIDGRTTLSGIPISLYTAGYSVTSHFLSGTPLPGLLVKLRTAQRNGNT